MQQRPSSEANFSSAFKKFPVFYGNLGLNNSPPPVIILSQINPVHSPLILLENTF
jgi:hypothetical protein